MLNLMRNHGFYGRTYFWRTVKGQEVDYVKEIDGEIQAFEFKWNPKAKGKIPKSFIEAYNPKTMKIIRRENFWEKNRSYTLAY